MKLNKFAILAVAGVAMSSCDDIELAVPEGNGLSSAQISQSIDADPSRGEAQFSGVFSMMGYPQYALKGSRADDFGFIMMAISNDLEGADAIFPNSNYNWFSVCGELTSRTANYANPRIRYATPYNQIRLCNDLITSLSAVDTDDARNKIAQCRAVRAFDYMQLAPAYQFGYLKDSAAICVPMVTEATTEFANNPRATVGAVYNQILADLDAAIQGLAGYKRPSKDRIDLSVAYGLRARANLAMGRYAEAAADAQKAQEGFTPASIADVSKPSFYDINDANWIWGIDMTTDIANVYSYATAPSWIGSFSADSYSAGTGCYCMISSLLFDKIPATDVRKGWWVDKNLHSDNLANVTWGTAKGDAVASLVIDDVKAAFLPYTNVKFGMMSGIGASVNDNDWPLMRVEEMILVEIEGLAKSGKTDEAKTKLTNFVKTYRDPSYVIPESRTLENEIWFQRRVELWGEGFFVSDANRLQKPIVRFHDNTVNQPDAFRFNLPAEDGWRLMRFPQSEINTNFGIIDNKAGELPVQDQHAELRDGVTD